MHLSTHFLGVFGPVWGSQDIPSFSSTTLHPHVHPKREQHGILNQVDGPLDPSIHPTQDNSTDHHS